jgi:hypothetical protein
MRALLLFVVACIILSVQVSRQQDTSTQSINLHLLLFDRFIRRICPSPFKTFGLAAYDMDSRGARVSFPAGSANFSLLHRVQTGSGAHRASYPMGTGTSLTGDKMARAWGEPLTSFSAEVKNAWSYTSTPLHLYELVQVKLRYN